MSTENERALDAFIRQLTKEIPLEEPHEQFTDTVLGKLKASSEPSIPTVYTPVFSMTSWVAMSFLAVALLLIGYITGEQGTVLSGFFSSITEQTNAIFSGNLPSISSSKILLLSSLALISCVAIQIVWLKKSWSKKRVIF
ncbi:hypothetical protein [uncultured Muriicola sp.]|uniref:hypothetical protein n=1 Tax=uncultured Muriicola sp. TaxID=1583102 RepID=UPI00261DF1B7|nr:hypothetical protein [uncultured Muriicola sp.]